MRRDTPRCCAIIITTGVIIPSPDLQRGWREVRNGFQPIAAGCLWCTFNGYSWPPRKMDGPRIVVIPISSPPRSILRETEFLSSPPSHYIYFISFILLFVTFPFFIHNFAKHSYRHILLIICLTSLLTFYRGVWSYRYRYSFSFIVKINLYSLPNCQFDNFFPSFLSFLRPILLFIDGFILSSLAEDGRCIHPSVDSVGWFRLQSASRTGIKGR